MIALQYLVFAAGIVAAIGAIVATVAPRYRRIAALLRDGPGAQADGAPARWRRVHLEADRRRPFSGPTKR